MNNVNNSSHGDLCLFCFTYADGHYALDSNENVDFEDIKTYEPCDKCCEKIEANDGILCIEVVPENKAPFTHLGKIITFKGKYNGDFYPSGRYEIITKADARNGSLPEEWSENRIAFIPREEFVRLFPDHKIII